jgi:hypothetical protein
MSLTNQILNLPPAKLTELHNTLIETGVAFELGGDHREVLRRARNRYQTGLMHRVYTRLIVAKKEEIDAMLKHLVNST